MWINWIEVCKFLSGAFFVNAGILFYFYLIDTPVPILGTDFVISPEVNGLRSIAHFAFFLITFYLGFIRNSKAERGDIPPLDGEGGEGRRPSPGGVTSPCRHPSLSR